jgi:hydroxyethylthiazole kinase-like uncharacterized protein yjeF
MQALPTLIHSTATVRAADRYAIDALGIPGYTLMTRAAEAAFGALRAQWPLARRVLVLCGRGNNGGDGYVLARYASAAGLQVSLSAPVGAPVTADAVLAAGHWQEAGGEAEPWDPALFARTDLVVDALLGTGGRSAPDAALAAVIAAVNRSARPILALDIPSGLDPETGATAGEAISATLTVAFVGLKPGLFLGRGPEHVGRLVCDDLDVPAAAFGDSPGVLRRITEAELRLALPRRARTAHKGDHGRVLVVAGGVGMPGAARLAAEAALRAGAGLVTLATAPAHAAAIGAARPELIVIPLEDPAALAPLLAAADVIAIGPGLGRSRWAAALVEAAFASRAPLVVDADALNHLADAPRARGRWCLTPHPGEAARLLGTTADAVQADRLSAAHALAERYDGAAVLKGAGTLIAERVRPPYLCERGNPGMAVAGMGDVLTGVIAGIAAQQPDPVAALGLAAAVGVLVHASAGEAMARAVERGHLASELLAQLPACVNPTS